MRLLRIRHIAFFILFLLATCHVRVKAATQFSYEEPYISSITINNDSIITIPKGYTIEELTLSKKNNNIAVRYACADSAIYQYFLEGFDEDWGMWTDICVKEYTNLPAGEYQFRTRYIINGSLGGEKTYIKFKVAPAWYATKYAIACYAILFFLGALAIYSQTRYRFAKAQYMLEGIINQRTEELLKEKDKSEDLLTNVLPENTANELMAKGKAAKTKYNMVTVLFSDIEGFTKIAENMNPERLIDELDVFFFHFDSVVKSYGIEKIKTIGDAYMCAGGIPNENRTNPIEVILAALEMHNYMEQLKKDFEDKGEHHWDIRMGIHTGTIIAGVVGQTKLAYDIWGDTVNTASRMESSGEAGKINISGTTYEFVKDFFECENRGKMPVKYKGEIDMYFVKGILPGLCDEEGNPNEAFMTKLNMIKVQDVEDDIVKLFDEKAPSSFHFHNKERIKGLSRQIDILSEGEQIPNKDIVKIKLAALLLETGLIKNYDSPQEVSCDYAEEILTKFHLDQSLIEDVINLITNAYNDVTDTLSDKILHDARYAFLGKENIVELSQQLYNERQENEIKASETEWRQYMKELIKKHDFLTETGRKKRVFSIEEQEFKV